MVATVFFLFLVGSAFLSPAPVTAAKTNFTIRQDGVLLKEGTPFFPFGFYHVSDHQNRYGAKLASDVEKMGQAGFNLIQMGVTYTNGIQDSAQARQKAAEYDMYVLGTYYRPSYQTWAQQLKDESTYLGWNTLDDFNFPYNNPKMNPTQAKAEADQMRNAALAAGAPALIYGSGGGYPFSASSTSIKHRFGEYKDAMDIFGVQTYPISNTDGAFANAPLEENIAYLKYSKQQLPENKPLFANTQAFAWSGGRYPNAVETRNMTWAAVVTRMEGILAYSYWEESGDLSTKTELWDEWKKLRSDINGDLVRALLDGKYTYTDTNASAFGTPRIHAATFEHNGKVFVIAMNTNSQNAVTTNNQIPLPANTQLSSKQSLFAGDNRYQHTLDTATSGSQSYLNGTLAASGIAAYVFTTSGSQPSASPTPSPTPSSAPVATPTPQPTTTPNPGVTPIPTPTPGTGGSCRSDFNNDKKVDRADYLILGANFFKKNLSNAKTDLNADGKVNIRDLAIFLQDYLKPCP